MEQILIQIAKEAGKAAGRKTLEELLRILGTTVMH